MKISLEWLAEYLPGPLDPQRAADALTLGGFPVEQIERHGDDTVLDVEITSNRGDCLSHVGIARELSALLDRKLIEPRPDAPQSPPPVAQATTVAIEATELCPHYTARVIQGVKIAPSPQWMRRRLEAVGLRPINNVVDVTNYVMFEMGQPLHAFDHAKLDGGRILVRSVRPGERLTSLDGHPRDLKPGMLVIADASRPVALAGVMGGKDSEVSLTTTDILLESARFDPLSVRKTARALTMKSDSSYRFERGIDPLLPERASLRAAELILQLAGGRLLEGVASAGETGFTPRRLSLRLERLNGLLGTPVAPELAAAALNRLGLCPVLDADRIDVVVPSHRLDLTLEVDLIEEVARVIGYDAIPVRDQITIAVVPPPPEARAMEIIRSTAVAAGYFEAVTFSWVSDALAPVFRPAEAASLARADAAVRKADAQLRPSVIPGLLEAVRHNETVGTAGARLFEIGSVFWHDRAGALVERRRIGLLGAVELRALRGLIEAILARLCAARRVELVPEDHPGYARGACARIEWDGQPIGKLGLIDPKVAGDLLSLRESVAAAEIELPPLLEGAEPAPQLRPLPRFPSIERDLSLIVPEPTRFAQIEQAVRSANPQMLEEVRYVTTYRGKPLEPSSKSVTLNLLFRSPHGTLTGEQIDPAMRRIIDSAAQSLGATLRA